MSLHAGDALEVVARAVLELSDERLRLLGPEDRRPLHRVELQDPLALRGDEDVVIQLVQRLDELGVAPVHFPVHFLDCGRAVAVRGVQRASYRLQNARVTLLRLPGDLALLTPEGGRSRRVLVELQLRWHVLSVPVVDLHVSVREYSVVLVQHAEAQLNHVLDVRPLAAVHWSSFNAFSVAQVSGLFHTK